MLWPDTGEKSDDLTVWIASPGCLAMLNRACLKGEGAEPTKGGSLKEVDELLDLLIIIVSRSDLYQQKSIEDHTLNHVNDCMWL